MKVVFLPQQKPFTQLLYTLGLDREQQEQVEQKLSDAIYERLFSSALGQLSPRQRDELLRCVRMHPEDMDVVVLEIFRLLGPKATTALLQKVGQTASHEILSSVIPIECQDQPVIHDLLQQLQPARLEW
jgi:hypothetical protein